MSARKPASWQVVLENTASSVEPCADPPDPRQLRFATFQAAKRYLLGFLAENRDDWTHALRRLTRAKVRS